MHVSPEPPARTTCCPGCPPPAAVPRSCGQHLLHHSVISVGPSPSLFVQPTSSSQCGSPRAPLVGENPLAAPHSPQSQGVPLLPLFAGRPQGQTGEGSPCLRPQVARDRSGALAPGPAQPEMAPPLVKMPPGSHPIQSPQFTAEEGGREVSPWEGGGRRPQPQLPLSPASLPELGSRSPSPSTTPPHLLPAPRPPGGPRCVSQPSAHRRGWPVP